MLKNLFLAGIGRGGCRRHRICGSVDGKGRRPGQQNARDNGKQMYASYCASCHGVDGRGNGPVAVL